MNDRHAIAIAGIALALATSGRANAQNKDTDHAQAVHDEFVDFGSPQPQPTPAELSHELVPNEVTINKGGTVTFRVNGGGHGIAIYPVSKNTSRDDVTSQLCVHNAVTDLCVDPTFANGAHQILDGKGNVIVEVVTNPPLARLDDPTDRLLGTTVVVEEPNGTFTAGAFHTGTTPTGGIGTQIQYRFEKTGRYLVICTNRIHSLNDWMFGFVDVVDADNGH